MKPNAAAKPLRRAVIYARFSSDLQSETSIEDQAFLCRQLAEREGMMVTGEYEDRAISGASMHNRLGLARLLRDARDGRFDIVLCEGLDRLSRDQGDLARLKKDLAFVDVGIVTLQDGAVGAIHIGLKGLMSEMFLTDLAQRTRRGQAGVLRSGRIPGGRSFGYDPVPGAKGVFAVNEVEADIVRRIFASYLAGANSRTIAATMNAEGVPGPRGARWNASTIHGSAKRQNGILQNSLYAGEIVWNRQRFIKDPATGRRVSRLNPETEWQRSPAPQLAIVAPELFAAVQQRRADLAKSHSSHQRSPRHLLSGLIRCSCCGSSYTVIGNGRIGCAGFRERGDCANNRTVTIAHVEERVLAALRDLLGDPELVAEYVRTFRAETARRASTARAARGEGERRLKDLTAAIGRTVDLLVEGKAPASLMDRLREMEAEKAALERDFADSASAQILELHPNAADKYRKIVEELQTYLVGTRQGEPADKLKGAVRAMIDHVSVVPKGSKKPVGLEVHGLLAQLLIASTGSSEPFMGRLVAGVGFEPTTFRL